MKKTLRSMFLAVVAVVSFTACVSTTDVSDDEMVPEGEANVTEVSSELVACSVPTGFGGIGSCGTGCRCCVGDSSCSDLAAACTGSGSWACDSRSETGACGAGHCD
jgi:hypothetical protein